MKMPQKISKKINLKKRDQWKHILENVEKDEVPVAVMERVTVNLIDGTVVDVNIRQLLLDGNDPHTIQSDLQNKLKELDAYIDDVDFHINIDAVVNSIQPVTDKILKDL
jgi:hypothetical protein